LQARLHQCEHCRAALPVTAAIDLNKSENYVSGRWEYQYALSNEGSRSEGYYGKLLFDGKPLPEPENINDYFQTP
jgi:hypothetical protein